MRGISSFSNIMQIKIDLAPKIPTIRGIASVRFKSESAGVGRIKNTLIGTKIEDNGSRALPGCDSNQNASGEKPDMSPPSMMPKGQTLDPNLPIPRGKSEATTHLGDGSISHRYKGGEKWEGELKAGAHGAIFESRACLHTRNGRTEMCIAPRSSQKRIFKDLVLEIDFRFRKFD